MSPLAHEMPLTHCNDPQIHVPRVNKTVARSTFRTQRSTATTDCAHADLSAEARELAQEIDRYKFRHRRRFINYEEILSVVKTLGYRKDFS